MYDDCGGLDNPFDRLMADAHFVFHRGNAEVAE